MSARATRLPRVPATAAARVRALARMSADGQVAGLRRGDYSFAEWSRAWPVAGRAPQRLEVLAQLDDGEQLDALRAGHFSLAEWCAFARRDPYRCLRIGNEFAFIVVTTPEWGRLMRARPGLQGLVSHLAALAGSAPDGGLLELRYRHSRGGMGQRFFAAARPDAAATAALTLGRRTDVYVGACPRTRREGTRAAVAGGWVLWADCDGPGAIEALRNFDPAPAIVVRSGTIRSRLAWSRSWSGVGRRRHVADVAGYSGRRGRGCAMARAERGRS